MPDNDQQPDPEMHKRLDAAFADDILDPMRASVEGALAQIDDAVNKARELGERAVFESGSNLLLDARIDEREELALGLRDVLAECLNPVNDAVDLLESFIQKHERRTLAMRDQRANDHAVSQGRDAEGKGATETSREGEQRSDMARLWRRASDASQHDWDSLGR